MAQIISYPVTGNRKFKYRTAILTDAMTIVEKEAVLNKFAGYGYRTAHMVRGKGEVLVTFFRRTRKPAGV